MITFIFFKLLVWVYGFEKDTIDVLSGIFAFASSVEFVFVVFFVCFNFSKIVTFIKGLLKK